LPTVPGGNGGVRPKWAKLLPEHLAPLGYRSYHSGKWHVDGKPLENGFHHSYSLNDHDRHFAPRAHTLDDKALPAANAKDGYYSTTAIADHAVTCLKDHAASHSSSPFFSFVAFTAPHFPVQAPAAAVAKYKAKYLAGWDALREERWKRMTLPGASLSPIERGLGPPYAFPAAMEKLGPLELNRPVPWAGLTKEQREFQAGKMAVHAAMVDVMDREIGKVMAQLKAMGQFENTLIFFLSDNGASAEIMVRGDGHDQHAECGTGATFLSIGPGWSSLANTPFRRHKTWVHEGGISTPFIVHGPNALVPKGEVRHTPGHVIDLVPTILAAAGGEPVRVNDPPPLSGVNLLPSLQKDGSVKRDGLWWLHEGNRAYRSGDWKIVAAKDKPWELYDLKADRSETNDLAPANREKVAELEFAWNKLTATFTNRATKDSPAPKAPKK
jgi:arylsulfatase